MGQITQAFCDQMLVHASRKEHSPLTIWEEEQLARAWLTLNTDDARYEALELEHFGDPDKKTGIYAEQPASSPTHATVSDSGLRNSPHK